MKKLRFATGLSKFDKSLSDISKHFKVEEKIIRNEIACLIYNPDSATVIPGFNNIKKLRAGIPDVVGKRKGLRFLCHIDRDKGIILPLEIWSKGDKEDLSKKEMKAINKELEELLSQLEDE